MVFFFVNIIMEMNCISYQLMDRRHSIHEYLQDIDLEDLYLHERERERARQINIFSILFK